MDNYHSSKVTLDDIVFEHRNKAYGAYLLRKIYDDNIIKALFISVGVSILTIAIPQIYNKLRPIDDVTLVQSLPIELTTIDIPEPPVANIPPPPKIETPPAPKPKASSVRFVPPVVAPDEAANDEPPTQKEMAKSTIGTTNEEGDSTVLEDIPTTDDEVGGGLIGDVPKDDVFIVVEQNPLFPGGMDELMRFMQRNTKYPEASQRAGITGSVFVQFVVGANGVIREAQVVRGLGFGCDEEAIRVVQSMPAWSPGKQGGRAVSTRFTLPFRFSIKQ